MNLEVISIGENPGKYEPAAKKRAAKLGRIFNENKASGEIYLIGSKMMRDLNRRFRGKDRDTNVLSFVTPEGFPGGNLGEIYLNPRYIAENNENFDLMLVHGVLHILGYDHERRSDRIKMEKKEAELLSIL